MSIRDERKQQSRQALLDAALQLSTGGRSFSSISLREVAREVGLVPTAFYRHFQDMDALGEELVDQVALHIKTLIHQSGHSYVRQLNPNPKSSIELFVQAVDQSPLEWQFMISERWGGSATVRQAIAREIEDLTNALSLDLYRLPLLKSLDNQKELNVLSTILINMSFTWAMTWLNLAQQYSQAELTQAKVDFIDNTATQVRLILKGLQPSSQKT